MRTATFAIAVAVTLATYHFAVAANDVSAPTNKKIVASRAFRSSTIEGMNVYNEQGQEVGTISELVIDVESGKVQYAALGVGGFLGIGEKLFAVPWRLLTVKYDEAKTFFVLDISKEVLERAPGFDKSNWPDVADPNWAQNVEQYYGGSGTSHTGHFVAFSEDQMVMRGDNKAEHRHRIAKNLVVMRAGKNIERSELREGDPIRVTLGEHDGEMMVTRVEVLERR